MNAGDNAETLLVRAERLEFTENRPDLAAQVYGTLASRAASDYMRGETLARLARSYRKSGRDQAAIAVYQQLVDRHADNADRFGRPYGLVAALELFDLSSGAAAQLLLRVRQDVIQGRWELTGDQVSFFLQDPAPRYDMLTNMASENAPDYVEGDRVQHTTVASLTKYIGRFFGRHEIKTGVEVEWAHAVNEQAFPGGRQ